MQGKELKVNGQGGEQQELSLEAATRQTAAKCHCHLAQILVSAAFTHCSHCSTLAG